MTVTMTMTEFNRYPSRVARAAQHGDVIITNHGTATLKISRVVPSDEDDPLARLEAAGLLQRAKNPTSTGVHPKYDTDIDLWAELDAERNRFE
jgi:antitoxin (DNA-binding transcriptional repressor) of toxin-antitoxin stability system